MRLAEVALLEGRVDDAAPELVVAVARVLEDAGLRRLLEAVRGVVPARHRIDDPSRRYGPRLALLDELAAALDALKGKP